MAAIVADTSPLIALQQIGQLSLLQKLFGEILVPPAVAREAEPSLPELPTWIFVHGLKHTIGSEALRALLGPGESEALGLAMELNAGMVILDEKPARRLALGLGLPVVGTMGILLTAKESDLIQAVRPLVDRLMGAGFRLSPAIRERVLADAGEEA
jgi:predicted nucleic acid-binding protein